MPLLNNKTKVCIYMRTATKKNVEYLERQRQLLKEHCHKKGYEIVAEISEIASGINEHRKGLQRLMNLAKRGEIRKVVVENESRLARFGLSYLKAFFSSHGVDLEIIKKSDNKESRQELMKDLGAVVNFLIKQLEGNYEV